MPGRIGRAIHRGGYVAQRVALMLCGAVMLSACAKPDEKAFVRVSPRDPHYFELDNGHPFIPIGVNLKDPGTSNVAKGMADMHRWMDELQANGGNHIRIWLSPPFWSVEDRKAGVYDETKAKLVDQVLADARSHGLRVKLTIEHFRSLGNNEATTKPQWYWNTLHDVKNGGTAASMLDWFTNPASRAQFLQKLDYYRNRYGDDPTIYAWELWNEVDCVGGVPRPVWLAWTADMLKELHARFPHNMATQSLGSLDKVMTQETYRMLAEVPGNDIAQVHRYLDCGGELPVTHGPVDVLAADAVREMRRDNPNKPIMLAESGAVEPKHSKFFKYYPADKNGIILHDVIFAPFFAGAAGCGQCWDWAGYVDKNHLWWQYGRFAQTVKGIDPAAEHFEPLMVPNPRLRVYLLRGQHTALVWARDSLNTWLTELADGTEPERLDDLSIDLSKMAGIPRDAQAEIYDPWTNVWSKVRLNDGSLKLPSFSRSIVARIHVN